MTESAVPYDLILKGGRVIDPATSTDGILDVAVSGGKIAAVGDALLGAAETIDVAGKLVLPGMIDTHAHVFQYVSGRFGLEPDMAGVRSGVTTLVDQGGPSCMTFPAFRNFIAEPSASRVLAFISIYVVGGLEGHYYPHLYGPGGVDVAATVRAGRENADLVRGIKAHAEIGGFERWGIEVMKLAAEAGRELTLPVYIHFGQLWPRPDKPSVVVDVDAILPDVVEILQPGDILAHPFTRHPGGFVDSKGNVHPIVAEALAKGLKIDVGHGSHFSFDMAKQVLDAGILPHTLGADMHGYNTSILPPPGTPSEHPDDEMHLFAGRAQFSLAHAMTELLALGVALEDIVPMVTNHCADMLGMSGEIGTLAVGSKADVSILEAQTGAFTLVDNSGTEVKTDTLLFPSFCLRAGIRYDADAPILPQPKLLAA
uniref:Predicted amidohydrolase n=1 Tax=uncultured alpha proteobacterium HF0130_06E21 TaxID=710808 RepID=E0XT06_9PROT|nr:predicted amidohydrolase [uncultured alpha proteobacterium HF0130_06E21]